VQPALRGDHLGPALDVGPLVLVGRTLKQLEPRPRWELTLIAIKRRLSPGEPRVTTVAPPADQLIREGDVLALLGANDRIGQLDKLLAR